DRREGRAGFSAGTPGLGGERPCPLVEEVAVVVRHRAGSFAADREPFPAVPNILSWTAVGFVAGLVLAAPLVGAAVGAALGYAGAAVATQVGIGEDFVRLSPKGPPMQ